MLAATLAQYSIADFGMEVRAGLKRTGQKELPSKYLYDEVGSALFEVITVLPEYGLSRADERLLREHADEIVQMILPARVVELGSGTGRKTRWILEALGRVRPAVYHPIEISATALALCAKELGDIEHIRIIPWEQSYLDGLASVAAARRDSEPDEPMLVLFLGSTIGNFDRPGAQRFLAEVRSTLSPGDALLLGVDLLKPVDQLIRAYDDSLGVTAAFNLNLLARINREMGADFHLEQFRHVGRYNAAERSVEMHLESLRDQTVSIPGAACHVSFRKGETIWTESSYKYERDEIVGMAEGAGFTVQQQWLDGEWPFAETLLIVK